MLRAVPCGLLDTAGEEEGGSEHTALPFPSLPSAVRQPLVLRSWALVPGDVKCPRLL